MKQTLAIEKNNDMITISRTEYEALKEQNAELFQQVEWLMEQIRLAKHKRFGASSEKSNEQLTLFNEAEVISDSSVTEPDLEEVRKHYRRKARVSKDRLPPNLPVEIVEHFLPEEKQSCPECGEALHVMGKEIRREFKLIPAKGVIVEHIRYVYSCRECEKSACNVPIIKAPIDKPVIKGSFASPEAVAHIMTQKFVSGVPLYRQEQEFMRNGIGLSRQTMSNWILRCTNDWLEPIYAKLHEILLNQEVLHADETTLQVLHEPGKTPQSKSYMWLYRTSGDAKIPIVLYEYQPDRRGKRPKEFLSGFKGYIHTDGYSGYHSELPEEITVVGCWSHARRKFDEALKGLAEKDRKGSLAQKGKQYCDRLFKIERQLKDISYQDRYNERQEQAKPVLTDFLSWLKSINPAPKSGLGKAVYYALSQWKYLERYIKDGRLEISNNRAERSIKPFVIDRKNFLFANTVKGARGSAVMFSIIETAKENGLNPYAYLTYIFKKAPNMNMEDPEMLKTLLPEYAPDECRVPSHKGDIYEKDEY
ncbi:MAG TPA: IS66 family transposase [Thermoanaerobacterales bacterium]|nr:IS66 family transposase [Thermoanaerobacterales bacterium]